MFFNKKNKEENTSNLVKIAALLIHTAKIDQNYSIEEEEIIKKTLVSLGAEQSDLDNLITKASKSDENANQILDFTKEIKNLEEMDKIKIVKSLWKIIYSNKGLRHILLQGLPAGAMPSISNLRYLHDN